MLKIIFGLTALISTTSFAIECKNYFRLTELRTSMTASSDNPLLRTSRLEKGIYPEFDKIQPGHFVPALDAAKAQASRLLEEIRNEKNPTFENVILKLESMWAALNKPNSILDFYAGSFKTPDIAVLEELYAEEFSSFDSKIGTDPEIFAKVKAVYDTRNTRKYDADQLLLLEKKYKDFVRSGALLEPAQKQRYIAISEELSSLGVRFTNNITDYKRANFVHITDPRDLAGIPADIVQAMEAAAKKRGLTGAILEMGKPSIYIQVMERAESDLLRQQAFLMMGRAGYAKDEFNNEQNIRRILELKSELAGLLGFKSYADYGLESKMAQNVQTVEEFLESLTKAYQSKAETEKATLEDYKFSKTGSREIKPWERAYWMRKYESENLSVDTNAFKDYLAYENVRAGFLNLVYKLYGITFKPRPDLPRIDPDVEVYQVISAEGETYGYITVDMYARDIKRGGAWMNPHSQSYIQNGTRVPSLVSINLNVTKPVAGKPLLLTLDEGETFYHEMGHALHGLLSRARYSSQSGTSVKWDFVELPSQVMENFFIDPDYMKTFAFHYETGKPIPEELLQKLKAQKQAFSATALLRQVSLARLDMAWHTGEALKMSGTLAEIDNALMNQVTVFKSNEDVSMSAGFSHIFAGGYSAGYYSYKWAEVLDADAYTIMKREGVEASRRFLKYVLEVGGSKDPNEAYKDFAGRPATIDALLERDGVK